MQKVDNKEHFDLEAERRRIVDEIGEEVEEMKCIVGSCWVIRALLEVQACVVGGWGLDDEGEEESGMYSGDSLDTTFQSSSGRMKEGEGDVEDELRVSGFGVGSIL